MAFGIEHHADVGLRLVLCGASTLGHCPGHPALEVGDADVEMHHHQLLAIDRRPHRRLVVGIPLHLELHVASW